MNGGRQRLAAAAIVLAALCSYFGPARGQEAGRPTEQSIRDRFPHPDARAKDEDFAGGIECKECHETRWKSLGTSFHADLRDEKKSKTRGCESCHGPGRLHVD